MNFLKVQKNKLVNCLFKDTNLNELLRGSSISLLLKLIGMLFGYLAMLFITNYYGAEEWGIYSLCFTILSISILLPKFGFDISLVRIITELNILEENNEIINVIFKALIISGLLSLLIIGLLNIFSDMLIYNVLNKPEMKPYVKLLSFAVIPMVILAITSSIFQALKKTALFILFQTTLINIVFLFLLSIYKWQNLTFKVFELYFYSICIALLISLYFLINFFKKRSINKYKLTNKYNYKSIINISLPMLLSNSFALLMGWSDVIMLSYYKTPVDIGIYDSALKLAMLSSISLIAINAVVTPKFVEFYTKNDILGLKDIVQKSTRLIFFTASPILLILIFFSKNILGFFGEEFVVGYLALIFLCISRFVNAISGSVGYIMQMTDQQKLFNNILIIAFIINVLLNIILIPKYSFTGAAIASSIAMIFWNITLVIIIKNKFGFWTTISFNFKKH